MQPYRLGILGATGLVGQRLVERINGHPWFELAALAASERSVGRRYVEAASWRLSSSPPPAFADAIVRACEPDALADCDAVLSALDTAVALEIEPRFSAAGFAVVSNSSAFRQHEEVPLLVPEVNPDHIALVESWRAREGGGFIVTNPNCSVTGLVIAMAPLHRAFGIRRLVVTTLQAISGAGIEGPRAIELIDNVIPYIAGEEDKVEAEMGKILGRVHDAGFERATFPVSAHCHRVPTIDGHLEAVSVEFESKATPDEAERVLESFQSAVADDRLPSAAAQPIVLRREVDRPQPRLDRDTAGGMAVVVGRVRTCSALGLKLELLSHNTVRGAAGGALLNAELLAARGLLPRRSS